MLTALFNQAYILALSLSCHLFPIYLLSTICAHPYYNHTAQRIKLQWSWRYCWVLGARNPRSIAYEVWSCRFQDKLCISDRLLFIVSLFYVTLLLNIPLWHHYMYGTWSWHTYIYAFSFFKKNRVWHCAPIFFTQVGVFAPLVTSRAGVGAPLVLTHIFLFVRLLSIFCIVPCL